MSESFELYKFYIAMKKHFTSEDYDFFKYGGKVNANAESFTNRKDKSFFINIAKRQRDPKEYVFACLLENPNIYIGDIATDKNHSDDVYNGWERRMQSLTYLFKEELGRLNSDLDSNFVGQDGKHPPLLKLYLSKKVSLETVVILDMVLGFIGLWDRRMKTDPIWKEISRRIKKYKPFLTIDLPKFKSIVKERFID
jgi:hypothetical protein